MPKRAKYKNPRKYVKDVVVNSLIDEMRKEGGNAPKDLVEKEADGILIEYEKFVVKAEHSYWQVILDGFLTNFLWWLFVALVSIIAFFANHESIKSAVLDLIKSVLDK